MGGGAGRPAAGMGGGTKGSGDVSGCGSRGSGTANESVGVGMGRNAGARGATGPGGTLGVFCDGVRLIAGWIDVGQLSSSGSSSAVVTSSTGGGCEDRGGLGGTGGADNRFEAGCNCGAGARW